MQKHGRLCVPGLFDSNLTRQLIFYACFTLWWLPEMIGTFIQRSKADSSKRDRGSYPLLLIALWIGLFVGFWSPYLAPGVAIRFAPDAVFFAGIVAMLLGIILRWHAIRVLGQWFTRDVAVNSAQTIVQQGPYKWVRHPAYSGTLLTLLGIGIAIGNWIAILAILTGGLVGHLYRISVEEAALINELDGAYSVYMQQTPYRLVPLVF